MTLVALFSKTGQMINMLTGVYVFVDFIVYICFVFFDLVTRKLRFRFVSLSAMLFEKYVFNGNVVNGIVQSFVYLSYVIKLRSYIWILEMYVMLISRNIYINIIIAFGAVGQFFSSSALHSRLPIFVRLLKQFDLWPTNIYDLMMYFENTKAATELVKSKTTSYIGQYTVFRTTQSNWQFTPR